MILMASWIRLKESMNNIYLIGNGYISDYIIKHRIKNAKFIGVCRSNKNNCDENISIDISKDDAKISQLITSNSVVIYLAPPQGSGTQDTTISNFLGHVNKKEININFDEIPRFNLNKLSLWD